MAKKSIVAGILSYGMSGRVFHAPFINQKTRFELRAIVERPETRAQQRYPNIISYDSVTVLLIADAIELVDRKSVGVGKSVSVCVYVGIRRIFKINMISIPNSRLIH